MSRNVSKCLYRDISETFLPTYWLQQFLIPNVLSAFSGTIFNIFLQQTRTILTIVRLFGPSNSLRLAFVILSTPTIRKIFIERILIILWEYQYSLHLVIRRYYGYVLYLLDTSQVTKDILKISQFILSYPLADCFEFRTSLACRCLCSQNISKYSNKPSKGYERIIQRF